MILINRVIEKNGPGILLNSIGIAKVLSQLDRELIEMQIVGNLASFTDLDYNKDDIITWARWLLERQRGEMTCR